MMKWKWWKRVRSAVFPSWKDARRDAPADNKWYWVWRKGYGLDIARRFDWFGKAGWEAQKGWTEWDHLHNPRRHVTHWWNDPVEEPGQAIEGDHHASTTS